MGLACFVLVLGSYGYHKRYIDFQVRNTDQIRRGVDFLKNALGPNDFIVFSNPNFGATFVYYFDRNAFFKMSGIRLIEGMDYFQFPNPLVLKCAIIGTEAFSLSRQERRVSTTNKGEFMSRFNKAQKEGGQAWLIYSPMNHPFEENPFFEEFGLKRENLSEKAPGVYQFIPSKI